ncbi:hypothetical protein J6590_075210 [Homalodisca vitripennis]|nr:hypothetical protein J6590_075210 [Homalodisca vitripennis]
MSLECSQTTEGMRNDAIHCGLLIRPPRRATCQDDVRDLLPVVRCSLSWIIAE